MSRLYPIIIAAAVVAILGGCASLLGGAARSGIPAGPDAGADDPASSALEQPVLPPEEVVLRTSAMEPQGLILTSVDGEDAVAVASSGVILALAERDDELLAVRISTTTPEGVAVAIGSDCRIMEFSPLQLTPPRVDGFSGTLLCSGQEQTLVVFDAGMPRAYVLLVPLSPVSRLSFRDLSADGELEIVRSSIVFEMDGRRELLVEAYRWDRQDLVLLASVPVLRRANAALDRLERILRNEVVAIPDHVLVPVEGSPPASSLGSIHTVVVPRLMELALPIDAARWDLPHEISLNGNIYRVVLEVQLNPLVSEPVRTRGLE